MSKPAATSSERMQRLRQKRADEGLVRVEFWCKPAHAAKLRRYLKTLSLPSKKA